MHVKNYVTIFPLIMPRQFSILPFEFVVKPAPSDLPSVKMQRLRGIVLISRCKVAATRDLETYLHLTLKLKVPRRNRGNSS